MVIIELAVFALLTLIGLLMILNGVQFRKNALLSRKLWWSENYLFGQRDQYHQRTLGTGYIVGGTMLVTGVILAQIPIVPKSISGAIFCLSFPSVPLWAVIGSHFKTDR